MNPDGIQYLDNASAYLRADFRNALNTQWSPLYPWLIAAFSAAVQPAREQEFLLAHAVNFFAYACSLAAFLYFIRCLQRRTDGADTLAFLLLSCSAFLYCSLAFTNLRFVTPDLLVNVFSFLAAALLLRIAAPDARARHFFALGAALGFGYLAKAPFFPIALVCLAIAAVVTRTRVLFACASFLAIAGPYAAALSSAKGRFTLGDSARLNIVWHVDHLPNTNWQGGSEGNGRPTHPTRQLSSDPAMFEFGAPIAGTYPAWYDPAYWNEGVRIVYSAPNFAHATLEQLRLYRYLLHRQMVLLFAFLALFTLARLKGHRLEIPKSVLPLLLFAALPFAMYASVHAEDRYLAPFFVLLWTGLFCSVLDGTRASRAIAITAALLMLAQSFPTLSPAPNDPPPRVHYEIASNLAAIGLKPGDRVAMVTSDLPYYWARLAGARITLQVTFGDTSKQREIEWHAVRQMLAAQDAAFLISPALEGVTDQPGWLQLGAANVFAYPLRPARAY